MDSIEISRQSAGRFHAAAVATGRDPWKPYAFACAEAARRLIDVAKVPAGDVRLFGGRAVYDPDALLIIHEDTGDDFASAFLVAHEIGHVEFDGQDEADKTSEVDPLRASEAVPVGVDRVIDYSQRQRREVQMDLFAREFLVPRPWVRKLHLEEGATAATIASRLGAPHAVVSQQLLDALLLPAIEIPASKEVENKPLKPDQQEAATHEGTPYLLEAGPGTGKTQTLVGRVEYLLTKGIEPSKILILTFSNKAAGELSERIGSKHRAAAASIWVGTFHGFGLDIIRRFHDHLKLPHNPKLLERTDAIGFLEDEYPKLGLKHFKNLLDPSASIKSILDAISRAQDEVIDAGGYRVLAEAMLESATAPEEREAAERSLEVATVFAAYEKMKVAKGRVDFGDLVAMTVRLCETNADVREYLATRYEHILVDEYQDVNRSSVRLLKCIAGEGRNLWAVGDVKQSIYRFRGASAFNMARFDREDFPGAKRGRLTVNYRSVEEIIDAYLTFAEEIPSVRGTEIGLRANRGKGGERPEYQAVETADQEIAAVAEAIEELHKKGYAYRDQAILSAGNERLGRMTEGLESLDVPVLYLGSLFERDEIKDFLSLLSLLVDRRAMGLLRVGGQKAHAIPLADVAIVLSSLKADDCEPMKWVERLKTLPPLSQKGLVGLQSVAALLAGFAPDANPWTVLCTVLLDRTRVAAVVAEAEDIRTRSRGIAIWQFMNFVRSQAGGQGFPLSRLLTRIRRLVLFSDERDLRHLPAAAQGIDAVRLMTMHGSKGLEFRAVHIPGLTNSSLPRSPNALVAGTIIPPDGLIDGATGKAVDAVKEALSEEQQCLFFVALSRARDRLTLYSSTQKSNGADHPRSPFIDRLDGRIDIRRVRPMKALTASPEDSPVPLTFDGPFAFTDHQLALYERCPRRFLYTHILDVGGRRNETAFMQLHAAVQKVIDGIGGKEPSLAELTASLDVLWANHGPTDHGYEKEYKRIAVQLLSFYSETALGSEIQPVPLLRLAVPGGEIVIRPDQVLNAGGKITMRRVDTGHKGSKDSESLATAAFFIAAHAHSSDSAVELVHLSDGEITPVAMTTRVLANRRKSIDKMGTDVQAGRFPLNQSRTCPRCPAFFICGPLPDGPMKKNLG
ncbi:MAG: UvrD-helicase domain-containing protein [Planctomycetes bacterium]|nr:UvrD-helicase domain-containing protein [Planctomycetota bacterium]